MSHTSVPGSNLGSSVCHTRAGRVQAACNGRCWAMPSPRILHGINTGCFLFSP